MSDKTITYTETAITTIGAMYAHVDKLASHFGEHSDEYRVAAQSLARVMRQTVMAGFGNMASVSRDGDLSLYVIEGTFHYGVIWHSVRRNCLTPGCLAYLNDDGTTWTYSRDHAVCDSHQPSYPLHFPHPGSWSTHS
jgi:hypothetical protein